MFSKANANPFFYLPAGKENKTIILNIIADVPSPDVKGLQHMKSSLKPPFHLLYMILHFVSGLFYVGQIWN
jgi:hypothetical protein